MTVIEFDGTSEQFGPYTYEGRVLAVRHLTQSNTLAIELHKTRQDDFLFRLDFDNIEQRDWEIAKALTTHSLVRIVARPDVLDRGKIANEDHLDGRTENSSWLRVVKLDVLAKAQPNLPSFEGGELSSTAHTLHDRLDHRVLDQRAAASGAIFKLMSGMTQLIVEFLTKNDFTWVHTPRLRASYVAGDNEYFHVPYFGGDAWLCQNSQHSLQGAIAMDMSRVFDIGPAFRQESKSLTSSRHQSEFTLLGVNMTYKDDWTEVIDMLGAMLLFVFRGLQERDHYAKLLEIVRKHYPSAHPFHIELDEQFRIPRISFLEAKRILREELGLHAKDDFSISPAEEAALAQHVLDSPFFPKTSLFTITHFPRSTREFNSVPAPDAPDLSETWDFIAGGIEVCSGSHRISDYDELCAAMEIGATGPPMNPESEEWRGWMDSFRAGMPKHAGASFGVNRMLQGFLGLENIRECTLFPRDAARLAP